MTPNPAPQSQSVSNVGSKSIISTYYPKLSTQSIVMTFSGYWAIFGFLLWIDTGRFITLVRTWEWIGGLLSILRDDYDAVNSYDGITPYLILHMICNLHYSDRRND